VELGRCVLKDGDLPLIFGLDGDNGLQGIGIWVELALAWRHHADDRPEDRDLGSQHAHIFNLPHVGSRDMVCEDRSNVCRYLLASIHLAAIEADSVGILGKEGGEVFGSAPVLRIE
jgi:hypothetical protein